MQGILEQDPDHLAEAIENDPELRALRDSSPICAELMSEPETMRILVDPDNLRALGDCPDLVQQDFANPNWTPPDVDSVPFDDGDVADQQQTGVTSVDPDVTTDAAPGEDEMALMAEYEPGEVEEVPDADLTDVSGTDEDEEAILLEEPAAEEGNILDEYEKGEVSDDKASARKVGASKKDENRKTGERGTFFREVAMGIGDLLAAELVGVTASEIMGGGDDELDQLAQQAEDNAASGADHAETAAVSLQSAAELAASDDVAGKLEETMDNLEQTTEESQVASDRSERGGTATAAAAGHGELPENTANKGKFAVIGSAIGYFAASVSSAAKETMLAQVLGDDLAAELVEKLEEEDEEEDDSNDKDTGGSRQK